jgi:hypothetical protein
MRRRGACKRGAAARPTFALPSSDTLGAAPRAAAAVARVAERSYGRAPFARFFAGAAAAAGEARARLAAAFVGLAFASLAGELGAGFSGGGSAASPRSLRVFTMSPGGALARLEKRAQEAFLAPRAAKAARRTSARRARAAADVGCALWRFLRVCSYTAPLPAIETER